MKSGWLFFFMLISMASALGQIRTAGRNLWGRDEVKHAAIGVCVKNVETGQIVYEYNPQMALRPASVIKLLSSALALKREGDSLTYTTKFFYTGEIDEGRLFGNIVIQAGGDPTLDSKYFSSDMTKVFPIVDVHGSDSAYCRDRGRTSQYSRVLAVGRCGKLLRGSLSFI